MEVLNHAKPSRMHPRMKCDHTIHYDNTHSHEILQTQPAMIRNVADLVTILRQGNDYKLTFVSSLTIQISCRNIRELKI